MILIERQHFWFTAAAALAFTVTVGGCGGSSHASHDSSGTDCVGCHDGTTAPSPTSGAHAAHVSGGAYSAGASCAECHQDRLASHATNTTPTVAFGDLADQTDRILDPGLASPRTGSAAASYDATTGTCSNVYCHGATLDGSTGTVVTPAWTSTAGVSGCDACHAAAPSLNGFHPASTSTCSKCHAGTVDGTNAILAAGGLHVNGVADYDEGDRLHVTGWKPTGHPSFDFNDCQPCHAFKVQCDACRACHGSTFTMCEG